MTRTIDTVEDVPAEKKRSVWKPLAAAGIGGAVLVATGFGVFAQLNATATNVDAQDLSSGSLRLALNKDAAGNSGVSFTDEASKLAPGDVVNRLVTLSNTGSLEGRLPKLQVTGAGSNIGPLLDGTRGLQITVERCATAWTPAPAGGSPSCASPLGVYSGSIAGLATATAVNNLVLTNGADNFLNFSVRVPGRVGANDETTVNGVLPSNSIQDRAVALTYTVSIEQRQEQVFSANS